MIRGTIIKGVMITRSFKHIDVYVCRLYTPGVQVVKVSTRSRMEALGEALKYLGLPL